MLNNITSKLFPKAKFTLTDEHRQALKFLEDGNDHIFLTGNAGTGKSTLIEYFRTTTNKKVVVLAPTGIAALRVKGQTIHSFFQFPPRFMTPKDIRKSSNSRLYSAVDTIILDEVSMVRADILDAIDQFMRLHGRDSRIPFGGAQMVFVGDMFQLPPVVTSFESEIFRQHYPTPYFFSAKVFADTPMHFVQLRTIFRQKDDQFIEVLNAIRNGSARQEQLQMINQRQVPKIDDRYTILTTTNKVADGINQMKLAGINKPDHVYSANVEGVFPTEERNLPVEFELHLKEGARVMFVKNDKGGRWVNGSLGTIDELTEEAIAVKLEDSGEVVYVEQESWENVRYGMNEQTGEVELKVLGKLFQYPLKLAWAITIHKSQGMTFDKVCIDFSRSPFAHGQTYVALSRCKSLKGLQLTRKIYPNDIIVDERITRFHLSNLSQRD